MDNAGINGFRKYSVSELFAARWTDLLQSTNRLSYRQWCCRPVWLFPEHISEGFGLAIQSLCLQAVHPCCKVNHSA